MIELRVEDIDYYLKEIVSKSKLGWHSIKGRPSYYRTYHTDMISIRIDWITEYFKIDRGLKVTINPETSRYYMGMNYTLLIIGGNMAKMIASDLTGLKIQSFLKNNK